MTARLIGETGTRKRRRFLVVPVLLVMCMSVFWIAGSQGALDAAEFELDRNSVDSPAGGADDWDNVHAAVQANAATKCNALGAVECAFVSDPQGTSIFTTGGSKDDLDISNWRHTSGSVPPKDEISNAYAAKYVNAAGRQNLYFGADRFATNGSADFGFWFFHNPIKQEANGTFSGSHQARTGTAPNFTQRGDILVLGTFQGTKPADIRVFEWVGTGGNATANGTVAGPTGTFGDCVATLGNGCGTVNQAPITVAWDYEGKSSPGVNEIKLGGFIEGGIDLTALGLDGCFSSVMAETRTSQSVDAQLKDFVLTDFESCGSSTVTTPMQADGVTAIPAAGIEIGAAGSIQVRDSAVVSVNGTTTYGGTVSFRICGPTLLSATEYTLCSATTGTAVGSAKTVNGTTATTTVVSDAQTITSVGRYCFSASYSGDAARSVPGSADSNVNECFKVLPRQPAIATNATAGPVALGTAISDSATLSLAASNAGGTITFKVYGPDDANCSGTAAFTSVAVAVTGNGTYSSGSFTPSAAGTYRWIAAYSGDANNLPVSGVCNAANETSVVSPRQPVIVTNATAPPPGLPLGTAISDSATLSNTALKPNGDPAGGTITFTVYGPDDANCSGTPAFTSAAIAVSGNGTYSSGTFTPTAAGTYRWIASYSGDLPNTLSVAGLCNAANEASLLISIQPAIATAQSWVPNDSATITAASGGGDLAGNVVFKLYTNADCSGTAAYTSPAINITSGSGSGLSRTVLSNNQTSYAENGTFRWVVEYTSTNQAHQNVTSACGKERSSLTIDNNGATN